MLSFGLNSTTQKDYYNYKPKKSISSESSSSNSSDIEANVEVDVEADAEVDAEVDDGYAVIGDGADEDDEY